MSSEMSSLGPNQIYRVLRPEPQSQDLKHSLPHSLETGAILYLVQENNLKISFFSKLLCRVKEPKETSKG